MLGKKETLSKDRKIYDFVIVTHLPSFYKINLYDVLAKKYSLLIIFIGMSSVIRKKSFMKEKFFFDHLYLNQRPFEKRSKFLSLFHLYQTLKEVHFKKCLLGGWELPEFWLLRFLLPKAKLAFALESGVGESSVEGFKGSIKRFFLKGIAHTLYSGSPQKNLLAKLAYKEESQILRTGGVGFCEMSMQFQKGNFQKKDNLKEFQGKFLYVGRLAKEKNLAFLLRAFKHFPQYELSLIGHGPCEKELKKIAPENCHFYGHQNQGELEKIYKNHDVFILPSLAEPWGLVVEEAIYFSLPVLASENVGAAQDHILNQEVGRIFNPEKEGSLREEIEWISKGQNYKKCQRNLQNFPFQRFIDDQIHAYDRVLLV